MHHSLDIISTSIFRLRVFSIVVFNKDSRSTYYVDEEVPKRTILANDIFPLFSCLQP